VPHVSRERVTAFTDAAVAIALTLLVLPLVESVRDTDLRAHARDFFAFALSFFVIARFWRVHRRLFDSLGHLDEFLTTVSLVWLFGIVFLPVPTAVLVAAQGAGRGAATLYAANQAFIALSALVMSFWVARHPGLWDSEADGAMLRTGLRRSAGATVLMIAVVPFALWLGQASLLLLLLLGPFQRLGLWLGDRLGHRQTAKS
jgi:uncharacterized membrane protein